MREEKIQLKTIKLETLNAECLMAANRCVRYLKQHHDINLRMQDKEVLTKLSKQVRGLDDAQLDALYQDLKQKILACMNQLRAGQSN